MNGSTEIDMNQHRFAGNRKQSKGETRKHLREPAINQLDAAAGTSDQLNDRIQEPYGMSNEEAARQLDGFPDHNRNWDLSSQ
jgi:uncharacterized protein YjbJ (UPF0337 family)